MWDVGCRMSDVRSGIYVVFNKSGGLFTIRYSLFIVHFSLFTVIASKAKQSLFTLHSSLLNVSFQKIQYRRQ
jgi:hypothetical protein